MTGQMFNSPYLKQMHERLVKSGERARYLATELNADQLNWRPSDDKWSIAQCLEHTLVGADLYCEKLRPAIERARGKRLSTAGYIQPRHTLLGHFILRAVEPTVRRAMSSPKIFAPTHSKISDDVVDRFIQSHENISYLISDCDGLNLSKLKLSSPVARMIRINAADAFEILVTHAERHLNQANRIRNSSSFPA